MSWARLRGSRSAGRTGCSKGYAGHTGLIHHSPENLLGRAVQSRVPMCSEDRTLPMRGGPGSAFNGAERAEMLVSVLLSPRKRVSCADRARLLRDLSHLEIFNSVRIRYRRLEATKDRAGLTSLHRMCPGPRKVFPPMPVPPPVSRSTSRRSSLRGDDALGRRNCRSRLPVERQRGGLPGQPVRGEPFLASPARPAQGGACHGSSG